MGATVVQDYIYESMLENADAPIELFHGYTYSGHPVACAAALATLDIYNCLLYTSPSPRDRTRSRMPSSA